MGISYVDYYFYCWLLAYYTYYRSCACRGDRIVILESFPVQVQVIARGSLPDPCTEISEVLQERVGDTFFITIKTYRSPGFCIQVLAPFEEIISLKVYGLPAGTYTIDVNGVQGAFDLEVENILSI